MSKEEKAKLDNWLAEHVMGWTMRRNKYGARFFYENGEFVYMNFEPTICADAALMVLAKCLKSGKGGDPCFISDPDNHSFWLRTVVRTGKHVDGQAETLELAISLFAKAMFSE